MLISPENVCGVGTTIPSEREKWEVKWVKADINFDWIIKLGGFSYTVTSLNELLFRIGTVC